MCALGSGGALLVFLVQHRQVTAKVVPVANVNVGSFSNLDDGMYGNITSRVEQNVSLDESYQVDKVFVKEGDHVSEGTPLFSLRYDADGAEAGDRAAETADGGTASAENGKGAEKAWRYTDGAADSK